MHDDEEKEKGESGPLKVGVRGVWYDVDSCWLFVIKANS